MKEECDPCAVRKEKLEGWMQKEDGNKLEGKKKLAREGKKIDFERHHKMMWHHSVAPSGKKSPPSLLAPLE